VRAGKTVWLVGLMGAGKSAVGTILAQRLGREFVDTDREIESETGRTVTEIFAAEGEAVFRKREREIVERLAGSERVVSLGGGAIAQPRMPQLLADSGTVVYLRATAAILVARLAGCDDRPLLAGLEPGARMARLESLLAERRGAYESASIVVDTDDSTVDAVVADVLSRLGAGPKAGRR
jgi:shikimate kinase